MVSAGGTVARRVVSPVLVGRTRELDLLVSGATDPPGVMVVEGEAGIGKTRLIAELRERPELAGHRFVVGACRQIREPFPLGPVVDAIRGLTGELAAVDLSPVAGALRPLLPEATRVLPPTPEPLEDRATARHRVFRALVEVLDAVGPVVLVLDDLHWADQQTVDFLSYLVGDPPARLSVVLTFRGEEVAPRVRVLTAKLPATVSHGQVVLAPLDDHETGELAAAILGVDRVATEFAAHLRERTSGVPFAVEELLALLGARAAPAALPSDGERPARELLAALGVPGGIRDSTLERVSRLPDDAQAVVAAAAVLQAPGSMDTLTAMLRLPRDRVVRASAAAVARGLLLDRGGAVGFRHQLAARAVYDAVPGPRRRELHERAASVLDGQDPAPLGQLAHQLRCAGRQQEWAAAAERAADQAVALGHDAEAVRLLVEILRYAPLAVAARGRLAVKLARAAAETVHAAGEVTDLVAEVLGEHPARAVRGELRFRLVLLLERGGTDPARLRPLLRQAVADLDDRPDLQAWAMIGLGLPVVPGVPLPEHRSWLHRALELLPGVADPAVRVLLLGKVAMAFAGIGDPTWRRLTEQMVTRTGGAPRQRREANAFVSVGMEACYAGQLDTAGQLLAAGREGAFAGAHEKLQLRVRAALALLDYCRGSWSGLADRADALVDQLTDDPFFRSNAEVVAGCLALARGELDRAAGRLADASRQLTRNGAFDVLPVATTAAIRLGIGRGDLDAALAGAERFLAELARVPFVVPAVRALPAVAEVMVAGGRRAQARALVRRWGDTLRGLDAPLAPAALRHARGFLQAAAAPRAAAGQFAGAAARYEALRCPYEAAQAYEQAARALLAAGPPAGQPGGQPPERSGGQPPERSGGQPPGRPGGQPAGVGEPLRAALATYARLGASWDFARAARLARQHGVPVPARYRGGPRGYGRELSPREREVAELAADGRTNKEIAAALYRSPETVKTQLRAVMRKLDVRSRAALSRRLTGGHPDHHPVPDPDHHPEPGPDPDRAGDQDRQAIFTPFGR